MVRPLFAGCQADFLFDDSVRLDETSRICWGRKYETLFCRWREEWKVLDDVWEFLDNLAMRLFLEIVRFFNSRRILEFESLIERINIGIAMKYKYTILRCIIIFCLFFSIGKVSFAAKLPETFARLDKYVKKEFSDWNLYDSNILDNSSGIFGNKEFQFGTDYSFSKSQAKIEISLSRRIDKNSAHKSVLLAANSHSSGQSSLERKGLGDFALTRSYEKNMLYNIRKNNYHLYVQFRNCNFSVNQRDDFVRKILSFIE